MTNEELEQEVKRLEEQITNLRIKLLESKAEPIPYIPYVVKVPEDIDDYYYTNEYGKVDFLAGYNTSYEKNKKFIFLSPLLSWHNKNLLYL